MHGAISLVKGLFFFCSKRMRLDGWSADVERFNGPGPGGGHMSRHVGVRGYGCKYSMWLGFGASRSTQQVYNNVLTPPFFFFLSLQPQR